VRSMGEISGLESRQRFTVANAPCLAATLRLS